MKTCHLCFEEHELKDGFCSDCANRFNTTFIKSPDHLKMLVNRWGIKNLLIGQERIETGLYHYCPPAGDLFLIDDKYVTDHFISREQHNDMYVIYDVKLGYFDSTARIGIKDISTTTPINQVAKQVKNNNPQLSLF